MFFRIKPSGGRRYLQIVDNKRIDGKVRQVVRLTIGRMDELEASGQLARLLASGARHCEQMMLLSTVENEATSLSLRRFGAPLLFGRLWQESGLAAVLDELLAGRQFEFPVERAVFATVLHRIMVSGSDRACDKWLEDYDIPGLEGLGLHHLYRAMAWLGEELADAEQADATPFAPRTVKDLVEERLFARRHDLFYRSLGRVHGHHLAVFCGRRRRDAGRASGEETQLFIKEVMVAGKRYIVCRNEAVAAEEAETRRKVIAALDEQLKRGDKALIGNSAYRRFLRPVSEGKPGRKRKLFAIDAGKLAEEARFDGVFVLRSNARISPLQAVLRYRDLQSVERLFRLAKATMRTRPIYHSSDAAIRGHVFCSFLALIVHQAIDEKLRHAGKRVEWACHPVARIISATVAPPGRRSNSSRMASLVGDFCDPDCVAASAFGSAARRSLAGAASVARRGRRLLADALRARCLGALDEEDFAMIGLRRLRRGPMPRHRREPGLPGVASHDAPFRRQVQPNLARATDARDLRRHRRIDLPSRLLPHQPLRLSQQNGILPTTPLVPFSGAGSSLQGFSSAAPGRRGPGGPGSRRADARTVGKRAPLVVVSPLNYAMRRDQ